MVKDGNWDICTATCMLTCMLAQIRCLRVCAGKCRPYGTTSVCSSSARCSARRVCCCPTWATLKWDLLWGTPHRRKYGPALACWRGAMGECLRSAHVTLQASLSQRHATATAVDDLDGVLA
eukprot:scaffold232366_cov19-Tisochrysis_lutea.AAC.2